MRRILALLLLTGPALANDALDAKALAQPGAVALYVQASQLYALGQAAKDPLTILTAARLLRGLTLTDTVRNPDPAPQAPALLTPLDPFNLIAMARTLDTGEIYTDLIEQVANELGAKPKAVAATASTLGPAATETWALDFYGGAYAELAVLGDGKSNLDLTVKDATGTSICTDRGSTDTALCGFILRENGTVTVTVTNAGDSADTYTLLTD